MNTVNVSNLIDDRPIGRFQIGVILLCASVIFAEGFDAQAIAYVAPSITADWGLERGALGPVFSAGLLGIMLGSFIIAPLADRLGRKPIILASTIAFAIFTLLTPLAWNTDSLLVLRFLTGFGLGGAMANLVSLTSEYSPAKRRSLLVMLMFSGISWGSALGGFFAAFIIPHYGWEAVFYVGGIIPLALVPVLHVYLPESLRFMANRDGRSPAARHVMARLDPTLPHDAVAIVEEAKAERSSVAALFADGRAVLTVMLWIIFFASLLVMYFIVNWLPTILNLNGASLSNAVIAGSVFQVGGFLGTLTLGLCSDKIGTGWALMGAYILGAICVVLIAQSGEFSPLTYLIIAGAGFGIVGGQIAANAMAATFYSTTIRSTGVGWALGVGRLGSVVGPAVGGMLLAINVPTQQIFILAALPILLAALIAGIVQILQKRRDFVQSERAAA